MTARETQRGQALVLFVGALALLVVGAAVLAAIAAGLTNRNDQQRAADLAALAAARSMAADHPRLFEPRVVQGVPNSAYLTRVAYLARARSAAEAVAAENGLEAVTVSFPGADPLAPMRVRVTARDALQGGGGVVAGVRAEAELAVGAGTVPGTGGTNPGEYPGPYALRQGKPMRPDVALAFDRMAAAARRDGHALIVVSGYRSDAEQAVLFAARPDPRWVARPGTSLHRVGTELDLGPGSAYPWLAANATRFHFVQRYSWEAWHYGYVLNPGSSSLGYKSDGKRTLPDFVPERFAPAIAKASQRWGVSAALLAAQIKAESNFNPNARSDAGAVGIAQFLPSTAAGYGFDPRDPEASIDGQAHFMHDLLRQLGTVPLALAGYNAGPAPVRACGCVPPYAETQAYVAKILAMLGGAGLESGGGGALEVRLVA